jgi:hypothetical protein
MNSEKLAFSLTHFLYFPLFQDGGLVHKSSHKSPGNVKLTFTQLEKEGIIIESHDVPEKR